MLQAHIVYLHVGECAIRQCLLDGKARVIGMYVHFHDILIRHTYNRVTDGFQESLEIQFGFDIKGLIQHDDKFCTVAEFNLHFRFRLPAGVTPRFPALSLGSLPVNGK